MSDDQVVSLHQPRISSNFLIVLFEYLRTRESVDIERFLAEINLELEPLTEPDLMLDMSIFLMLIEQASTYVQDPDLGLHYYENFDFRKMGILGYGLLNSKTLGEGLALANRYYCLFQTDMEVKLCVAEDVAELTYQITARNLPYSRQDSEMTVMGFVTLIRNFVGNEWNPDALSFQHPAPVDISEHCRLLGCKPLFNQPVNKIVFPGALLDSPMANADDRLSHSLAATLDQLLQVKELKQEDDWLESLQEQIVDSLGEGVPAIETIADRLHVSGRTLQRKLQKKGISFKELVEKVRYQLAANYLSASNLSMTEIAFLLGYTELSSFNRAFKRWSQHTPIEYRDLHRNKQ